MEPASRAVWDRVMHEFASAGVVKAADTDVLRMYCDAVARYEESSRLLARSGPLIKGARSGDFVRNPLHQIVRDNAKLVQSLAGELGLTPAARTGLTWQSQPKRAETALDRARARRLQSVG